MEKVGSLDQQCHEMAWDVVWPAWAGSDFLNWELCDKAQASQSNTQLCCKIRLVEQHRRWLKVNETLATADGAAEVGI